MSINPSMNGLSSTILCSFYRGKNDFIWKARIIDTISLLTIFFFPRKTIFIYLFYPWSLISICLIARGWDKLEFSEMEFLRETRVSFSLSRRESHAAECGTKIKRKVLRLRCKDTRADEGGELREIYFLFCINRPTIPYESPLDFLPLSLSLFLFFLCFRFLR